MDIKILITNVCENMKKHIDIAKIRKSLYINSQYCNYYREDSSTIVADMFRSKGYKYTRTFSHKEYEKLDATYRKYNTIINSAIAIELLLYVYLFVFPYFTKIMQLPFILAALVFAFIPMLLLLGTYHIVNIYLIKELVKNFGTSETTEFKPQYNNINNRAFFLYMKTKRKSAYVLALIFAIFMFYILTPMAIDLLVINSQYQAAIKVSNIYTKFIPISADTYAQRGYSKYKLKKYAEATKDYELANEYSLSKRFNPDIVGIQTYYLPKEEVLKNFDELLEQKLAPRTYIKSEKALYEVKHGDYAQAIEIYNEILAKYENHEDVSFSPEKAYYFRAYSKIKLNDKDGARIDLSKAEELCQDCKYSFETKLIRQP